MSNIDFSRLVTSQAKAEQAARAHKDAAKAACKQRISSQFPIEAQQNVVQALTLHTLELSGNAELSLAKTQMSLSSTEIELALQAQAWIGAMQATCRALSSDPQADMTADEAWPRLTEGAAQLIARF